MEYKYYEKYINKKTKNRYDVTPIFAKPKIFRNLINDLIKPFKKEKFDKVVSLEALGFIIGAVAAHKLGVSFVPVRKGGKLPGIKSTVIRTSFIDYTKKKKVFEMNKDSIKKGDKVLIIDEWIETGAQIRAAIELIKKQGGKVIGISTLGMDKTSKTKILVDKYNCKSIK